MSDRIRSMTLSTVSIHIICDSMLTPDTVLIHILGGRQNNFFREVNDNKVSSVSHPLDHGVACYTPSDFFFFFSKSTFASFFFINWKPIFVLRANEQKNRAKSANPNRGHSSKTNLLSFSVCNKVLMSL